MGFTDEDLKRLKKYAEWKDSDNPTACKCEIEDKDLQALLARLEASERKNRATDAYDDFDCPHVSEDQCKCGTIQTKLLKEVHEADEAWRTACGK